MNRFAFHRKTFFFLAAFVCIFEAQAGRPLTVDDASQVVNTTSASTHK